MMWRSRLLKLRSSGIFIPRCSEAKPGVNESKSTQAPCGRQIIARSTKTMQPETQRSTLADPILMELEQEAQTTRKLLNIIPEDKLGWRPHPKAKSLGELAVHIARLQGGVAELARTDQSEMPDFLRDPAAES